WGEVRVGSLQGGGRQSSRTSQIGDLGVGLIGVWPRSTLDLAGQGVRRPGGMSVGGMTGRWYGRGSHERSEEHTSELQSRENLVCRLLLEKKKTKEGAKE